MNAKDICTTAAERLGAEESTRHQAAEEIADTGIPAGEQNGPLRRKSRRSCCWCWRPWDRAS